MSADRILQFLFQESKPPKTQIFSVTSTDIGKWLDSGKAVASWCSSTAYPQFTADFSNETLYSNTHSWQVFLGFLVAAMGSFLLHMKPHVLRQIGSIWAKCSLSFYSPHRTLAPPEVHHLDLRPPWFVQNKVLCVLCACLCALCTSTSRSESLPSPVPENRYLLRIEGVQAPPGGMTFPTRYITALEAFINSELRSRKNLHH